MRVLAISALIGRSAACTVDPTGCLISCPTQTFDLTGFAKQMPVGKSYFHGKDSQKHDYWFTACGVIKSVTCKPDNGGTTAAQPAALQSWGSSPMVLNGKCAAIGDYTTQVCVPLGASPVGPNGTDLGSASGESGGGVACAYTDGDDGGTGKRSVTMTYTCAAEHLAPTAAQLPNSNAYAINFEGPAACAVVSKTVVNGLSGGSIFLICLAVTVFLYLGGGITYNYKYRELRGIEVVPQIDYWKQLPGLVYDGCKFSAHHTARIYNQLRHGKYSAMNTEALKQGLNEDEEALAGQ